jgi:type II secretory pathway component PulF
VALFLYKAVNQAGGHVAGTIEAADRKSAVADLLNKEQFVVELAEEAQAPTVSGEEKVALDLAKFVRFGSRRINSKDILAMTTQLGTALRAGLPLLNGLELIREQQHKAVMKEMLDELVKSVSSGQSLSEAMAKHENTYSPLYISMIRVGETGGMLDETTTQLAEILSRDEKIKTNMKNASAYPIFVLGLGLVSVVIILTTILPKIIRTIGGGYAALPLPTKMLLRLSDFTRGLFTTYYGWIVIVLIVAGLYYLIKWTKSTGRIKWASFKLKIPLLGSVHQRRCYHFRGAQRCS